MKPSDLIFWHDDKFGKHRFYEVQGVFIGADGQESLIELRSLTERPGVAYGKNMPDTTFVPEPLLRACDVYSLNHSASS